MYTLTETAKLQNQLANYCRNGKKINLPGARNEKLHHYRRLVFNVVKGIMDDAYPITKKIFGEKAWDELIEEFHASHDSKTPQVWKLPKELLDYAKDKNLSGSLNMPWLHDLMLLEWIEIEVYMMPDVKSQNFVPLRREELNSKVLVFNPEYRIVKMKFPVHMMAADKTADKKGRYFLLVYREPQTGRVQFINLSPFSFIVLEALLSESTLDEWWENSGKELNLQAPETSIKNEAGKFLHMLHGKHFLYGFHKS